jgi:hypothetical protein
VELLGQVETEVTQLLEAEPLKLVGGALSQVVAVDATRSQVWMMEWAAAYWNLVLQPQFFAEMVRRL